MKYLQVLALSLVVLLSWQLSPLFVWQEHASYGATLTQVCCDDIVPGSLHRVSVELNNQHSLDLATTATLTVGQQVEVVVLENAWGWRKESLQLTQSLTDIAQIEPTATLTLN